MTHEYEFGIIDFTMNKDAPKKRVCKSIFNPYIARHLLRMGNQIVDIKKDKSNSSKTIFLFEVTEKFQSDLENILKGMTNK